MKQAEKKLWFPAKANVKKQQAAVSETRPALSEIIALVEKVKAEQWDCFRDRYGDWGRDLALYLGRKGFGIKPRELGAAAGGMDYMSVSAAVQRLERRVEKEPALSAALTRCRKELKM